MRKVVSVYLLKLADFNKTRRLLKKSEFEYVFSQAKKMVAWEFIFLYRDNELGHARLGLALSKKKIPQAHDRNYIKRRLRETFRVASLPAIDVIVLARQGISEIHTSITSEKLSKAWQNLATLYTK